MLYLNIDYQVTIVEKLDRLGEALTEPEERVDTGPKICPAVATSTAAADIIVPEMIGDNTSMDDLVASMKACKASDGDRAEVQHERKAEVKVGHLTCAFLIAY